MQRISPARVAPYSIVLPASDRPGMKERRGEKAALLFHGITGTPSELSFLADELQNRGYDVFAPCLSGHGTSLDELRKVPHSIWLNEADELLNHIAHSSYSRIIVGGLSFGALLALHAVECHPSSSSAAVLISAPFRFRSPVREPLLRVLSYLPDVLLDLLPMVKKTKRLDSIFVKEREAYHYHSVAAAARVVRIRRTVLLAADRVRCPVLLLQDPYDHHLSPRSPNVLRAACRSPVSTRWFPGGEHELTIGHYYREVIAEILRFVEEAASQGEQADAA